MATVEQATQRSPEAPAWDAPSSDIAAGASSQLRDDARALGYAEAQQALRPSEATPASIADHVPEPVDLRALRAWFRIPAGTVLSRDWKSSVQARHDSTVGAEVTGERLRLWCSPGLRVGALWPVQNMTLWGATYDFRTGQVHVDVGLVGGLGQGFVDRRSIVQNTVSDIISQGLSGTPAGQPGYDPLRDPAIGATLEAVTAGFASLPSSGGGAAVDPEQVRDVSVGATLALREPFYQEAGVGAVQIEAGGVFDVRVNGGGTLGALAQAQSAAEGAQAAQIRSVSVSSEAVVLLHRGQPILRLQHLEIARGGVVRVSRFELLGRARTAAGVESLLRLLGGTLAYASQGAPPELAAHAAARHAQPDIVDGIARAEVEQALTDGVQALLREHAGAIPGLDLSELFDVSPEPQQAQR